MASKVAKEEWMLPRYTADDLLTLFDYDNAKKSLRSPVRYCTIKKDEKGLLVDADGREIGPILMYRVSLSYLDEYDEYKPKKREFWVHNPPDGDVFRYLITSKETIDLKLKRVVKNKK